MEGKVAIITGATRGIGRATLERFVERGARVIGTYLNSRTEAENICIDHPVDMVRCDVRKRLDIQKLCTHVSNVYGNVDVIVNNAGHWEPATLDDITVGQIEDMFDAHCHGPMWMVKYASLSNESAIVNVSSIGGMDGGTQAPHYAAAKAAVISWTRSLSRMLAPRTRVNAVAPGWIDTKLHDHHGDLDVPLKRWGKSSEVAYAIEFLAGDTASYITGQVLRVDGGA